MKKCRVALRRAISADESKVFCNLLGTTLLNSCNENEDEGILGFPAMVSRPLDFRTIDFRLAAGVYYGLHDVFLEDVREVCSFHFFFSWGTFFPGGNYAVLFFFSLEVIRNYFRAARKYYTLVLVI